jgi:PKD repeat protein
MYCKTISAQAPQADFTAKGLVCRDERIAFVNSSSGADTFQWDFCVGDLETLQEVTSTTSITGLSNGFGYKLVQSNGLWFGFAVSQTGSKLLRLDFGDSPLNTPLIADLGNPDNLLVFPHEIEVYSVSGTWYGFVTSNQPDQGLVKLNFGSSLTNTPTALNIGNFGVTGRIWDLSIVRQSADLIMVVAERNAGTVSRINFRDSFENPIIPATHVFTTGAIVAPGGYTAPGLDVVNTPAGWIVLLTSFYDSKIYQINFGPDIMMAPSTPIAYTFSGVSKPYRVRIIQEGPDFYAIVSNDPDDPTANPIKVINFKDLNPVNPPVGVNHIGLPELIGIDVIRFEGQTIVQGVGTANANLHQMRFESACDANPRYMPASNPGLITYNTAGIKQVELKAINSSSGVHSIKAGTISVSADVSPDIDFDTDGGVCSQTSILFSSKNTSADLTDYAWNFGDTQFAVLANPTHAFSAGGEFLVALEVTATNGCTNSIQHQLTLFNPPVADFSLPALTPLCTNQSYLFSNESVVDAGSTPDWDWSINGVSLATSEDFSQTFFDEVPYDIKLSASLPGCSSEKIITGVSVLQGPQTDFVVNGKCEGATIQFTNLSTGGISDYQWDFGGESTSTELNPNQTFSEPGVYSVTLTSNAINGCNTSETKTVTIFSKPQASFSLDLPPFSCAGTPSQFHDLTPVPNDSNLESWTWIFGDGAQGTGKNPSHIYSIAGQFQVELTVATNQGCLSNFSQSVTISPSPHPDFTFDAACVNKAVHFEESSTGLKAWQWKINNSNYTVQNPTHVFLVANTYNAQLTVTATNDCVGSVAKTIVVPPAPLLNFSIGNPCVDQPSTFTNLSTSDSDPIVSTRWDFAGNATHAGLVSYHSFSEPGSFPVKMKIQNESGCEYELVKNVTIFDLPVASFEVSAESGPPPLRVDFKNNSTGAATYRWLSNNVEEATTKEFTKTFNDLGGYVIDLYATSQQGCVSSYSREIKVIIPRTELELEQFNLVEDPTNGAMLNQLVVTNRSNYTIREFDVVLDLGNGTSLRERVGAEILPNASYTFLLTNSLIGVASGYVCVELVIEGDEVIANNKLCIPLTDEPVLFTPSPNPAQDFVDLEVIATRSSPVSVRLVNAIGDLVSVHRLVLERGRNKFHLDVDHLSPGIYHITIESGTKKTTHRLFIR